MNRHRQISFRVDSELGKKIDKAAKIEELKIADLVRKIFSHAWKRYERAGSLHTLRKRQ